MGDETGAEGESETLIRVHVHVCGWTVYDDVFLRVSSLHYSISRRFPCIHVYYNVERDVCDSDLYSRISCMPVVVVNRIWSII